MSIIQDPTTGQPIPFEECLESQDYSFSGNSHALRRSFFCPWAQRFGLAAAFMGGSRIVGKDTLTPKLDRRPPVGFSVWNGETGHAHLHATGIERIVGVGPTRTPGVMAPGTGIVGGRFADTGVFTKAKVSVIFEAPTYTVRSNAEMDLRHKVNLRLKDPPLEQTLYRTIGNYYVSWVEYKRHTTRIVQPMTEAFRIPDRYWHFVEGLSVGGVAQAQTKTAVDTGTFLVFPKQEITYVLHGVPAMSDPWSNGDEWLYRERDLPVGTASPGSSPELLGACYTHLGTTNARWFDGYAPGTLLLTAVEARPYKDVLGNRLFDYTYRMSHFNPVEVFDDSLYPFVGGKEPPQATSRNYNAPYQYAGWNYLPRFQQPVKDGPTIRLTIPFMCAVSHNGEPFEGPPAGQPKAEIGRPLFRYTDFEDLFLMYNKSLLIRFYQKATLLPLWEEVGT